jgi:hypothetical protein
MFVLFLHLCSETGRSREKGQVNYLLSIRADREVAWFARAGGQYDQNEFMKKFRRLFGQAPSARRKKRAIFDFSNTSGRSCEKMTSGHQQEVDR